MKVLLVLAVLAVSSQSVMARTMLIYKTVSSCETLVKVKGKEVEIQIQQAQNKQARLVVVENKQSPQDIEVSVKTPPAGMAGGSTVYSGKDTGTDNNVRLVITHGTTPVKVGSFFGRRSILNIENRIKDLILVCGQPKN